MPGTTWTSWHKRSCRPLPGGNLVTIAQRDLTDGDWVG